MKKKWTKEQEEEFFKKLDKIGFTHDLVFCEVFSEKVIAEKVLQTILGETSFLVKEVQRQKSSREKLFARETRFDVLVEEESGRLFDLEMQNSNLGNLYKRADIYASKMTLQAINDLEMKKIMWDEPYSYGDVPDRYVIFFCNFDIEKEGYPIYFQEKGYFGMNFEKPQNGNHQIFINIKAYEKMENENLKNLSKYLATGKVTGELTKLLEERRIKMTVKDDWRDDIMTLEMMIQERVMRGREEEREEMVRNMAEFMDLEEVAKCSELSLEKVKKILGEN